MSDGRVFSQGRTKRHGPLTFDTQQMGQSDNGFLIHVCRDVGHQRQVFHQTTGFSFRGIARTQHSPLTRLQRTRSTNLPRLLELRADTRHHSESGNERKAREHMGYTSPIHFESLEGPVPGGYCSHETGRNEISGELHSVEGIELRRAGRFLQDLVDPGLQCRIEGLEQVLE